MEAQDFIGLPAHSASGYENEMAQQNADETTKVGSQPTASPDEEDKLNSEKMGCKRDTQFEDGHFMSEENLQSHLADTDSDMEIEDISVIPALSKSTCGVEENGIHGSTCGTVQTDCQPSTTAGKKGKLRSEKLGHNKDGGQCVDNNSIPEAILNKDLADSSSLVRMSVKLNETLTAAEELNARVHPDKNSLAVQDESHLIETHKNCGSRILQSLSS